MSKNIFFMVLNLLSKLLINIILFVFLARLFPVSDMGEFMFYFSVMSVLVVLVDFGFGLSTVKEMSEKKKEWKKTFREALSAKVVLLFIVLTVLVFIISVSDISNDKNLWLISVSGVFSSFTLFFLLPLRILGEFRRETLYTILFELFVFFSVILVALFSEKNLVNAVSWGLMLSRLFCFITIIIISFKKYELEQFRINFVADLKHLRLNLSYGIHLIVGTLYLQIDTLIIEYLVDTQGVAHFQSAMRIIIACFLLSDAAMNVLLPASITESNATISGIQEKSKLVKTRILLLGFLATIVLYLFSNEIILIMYGNGYQESSEILKVLCFLVLFRYITSFDSLILTVINLQHVRMIISISALLTQLILSFVLVKVFGIMGGAYSSLLISVLLMFTYKIVIIYVKTKTIDER